KLLQTTKRNHINTSMAFRVTRTCSCCNSLVPSRYFSLLQATQGSIAPSTRSKCIIMDGNRTAEVILKELAQKVDFMKRSHGIVPGLAGPLSSPLDILLLVLRFSLSQCRCVSVILVGNRPDSLTYVQKKQETALSVCQSSFALSFVAFLIVVLSFP